MTPPAVPPVMEPVPLSPRRTVPAQPSPEELAAIVAAVEMAWPRPVVVAPGPETDSGWRFSGRWWARPATLRRERPWRS